ncbi:MAG: shikimate kinase [Bacillota bacterium]
MNIVLIGLMGSGKSAVGRLLAERLGRPFVDTDELVVQQTGRSIADLFATEGEAAFREREAAVIAQVTAHDGQVIATGGGAVLRPENREALRRTGLVIWLDAPPEALYQRARAQGLERRPLLAGPNPLGKLRALAAGRAEAYQAAAHVRLQTDAKIPASIAEEIIALLASNEGVTDHG